MEEEKKLKKQNEEEEDLNPKDKDVEKDQNTKRAADVVVVNNKVTLFLRIKEKTLK